MLFNILGSRSARRTAERAGNIQAGQAGENAALSRELAYRYNPYLQQSAEQWSGNVRNVYDEAGNLVMDTAGNAAAGVRGAATQANQYLDPYYQTGNQANQSLYNLAMSRLNAAPEEFTFDQNDPSYQWRLQQGANALERSAAARGGLASGNTLKALTGYGQGMASQEYAAEHARWLAERTANRADTAMWLDPLSGVAGRGLTAGNQMGQNLLTGEKYAGDWTTQGARDAGLFRGKGAEFQSNLMHGNLKDIINLNLAGEQAGMNYMTDRAAALSGGVVGAGNAQTQMWSDIDRGLQDMAMMYMTGGFGGGSGGSRGAGASYPNLPSSRGSRNLEIAGWYGPQWSSSGNPYSEWGMY